MQDTGTELDEAAAETTGEERLVRDWRLDQFLRLGFGPGAAVALVDSPADLSVARRLIGQGCPPATAAAILL